MGVYSLQSGIFSTIEMSKDTEEIIFISYASPDRERVIPFFEHLEKQGINVWMDDKSLKGGQNWDFEIKRVLEKATVVLTFVSKESAERRGYIQKELRIALDKRDEKLIDDIYLVPVLLDDIEIPESLKAIHCIRASDSRSLGQIEEALKFQLDRLGIERKKSESLVSQDELTWSTRIYRETYDGIPGYEVELEFLSFKSEIYKNISEASDYIRGNLLQALFEHRAIKLKTGGEDYNFAQDKWQRTDSYDAHCLQPTVVGKILSIQYGISWYGAGAAHPNYHFATYSFLLDPLILIEFLEEIFNDSEKAFELIQESVRRQLYRSIGEKYADGEFTTDWIDGGTGKWEDFNCFNFKSEGLEFLFSPYQVDCYAHGSHSAFLAYKDIAEILRPVFISALNIYF